MSAAGRLGGLLRYWAESFSLYAGLGMLAVFGMASPATAQIAPWINPSLFDSGVWDTAGPYADSPWYHPPPQSTGKNWGLLTPGAWRDGSWQENTSVTGTWGGARNTLFEDYGLALAGGYGSQISSNPVGGKTHNVVNVQSLGLSLFADLDRMMGWKGGYFVTNVAKNWGKGLSKQDIGNFFPVQYAQGTPSVRLVQLALVQNIFDNTTEIALGRLVMANDFGGSAGFCASVNQVVCSTPISATKAVSFGTFPYGTWGGRIKVKPNRSFYAQAGVYAAYPDFRNPKDHGVRFGLPKNAGPLLLVEGGWIHGSWLLEKGVEGAPTPSEGVSAYGGKIKVGGYSSWEVVTEQRTERKQRGGAWGLYVIFEQDLYLEDPTPSYSGAFGFGHREGLDGFLSLSYSSEETSPLAWMAVGGLVYRGLIPGRGSDVAAFVAVWGRFSEDLRDRQRANNQPLQHYELVLELNYRIALTGGFFVQPDIQGVIMPSGKADIPAALVLSINFGLAF